MIEAPTNIASVPLASTGAENSIPPNTSPCETSVLPACKARVGAPVVRLSLSNNAPFDCKVISPPSVPPMAAAAEVAVVNFKEVALLDELKSPSDYADIQAATIIASVPVPSSGA